MLRCRSLSQRLKEIYELPSAEAKVNIVLGLFRRAHSDLHHGPSAHHSLALESCQEACGTLTRLPACRTRSDPNDELSSPVEPPSFTGAVTISASTDGDHTLGPNRFLDSWFSGLLTDVDHCLLVWTFGVLVKIERWKRLKMMQD